MFKKIWKWLKSIITDEPVGMTYLKCTHCGTNNSDPNPNIPSDQLLCGRCTNRSLVRLPISTSRDDLIVSGILGAGFGGALLGPGGAVLGGLIGLALGKKK